MHRVTIKRLLFILGVLVTASFAATVAFFLMFSSQASKTFEEIIGVEETLLAQYQEMYGQGLQTEQATRNLVLNPQDETALANYAAAHDKFNKALELALKLATGQAKAEIAPLPELWDQANALKREIQSLAASGQEARAKELLNTKETKSWREIRSILLARIEAQSKQSQAAYAAYQVQAERTSRFVAAFAAVVSLFLIAALWLAGRRILVPLRAIEHFATCFAGGDFTTCLQGTFSGELREVADSLAAMTAKVQDVIGFNQGVLKGISEPYVVVDAQSRLLLTNTALLEIIQVEGRPEDYYGQDVARFFYGDPGRKTVLSEAMHDNRGITKEVELTGRKGGKRFILIAASPLYNDITGKLMGALCLYTDLTAMRERETIILDQSEAVSKAAQQAEGVARELTESAGRLTARVGEVEHGAADQKKRAAHTAESVAEMSRTISEVAANAARSTAVAEDAGKKAGQGERLVEEMIGAVKTAQEQASSLKDNMHELGLQAEAIGRIMGVINDIADQTNLLALNAAIEAARAGEAGRGFAVVADEVRKLAEKTMAATKEVGESIQNIQDGTKQAVGGVDQAVGAIERTTQLARDSGQALAEIVGLVNQTTDRMRAIAVAVEEQSAVTVQIRQDVSDMAHIAEATLADMGDASSAVLGLGQLGENLRDIIESMAHKPQAAKALGE
jgi:methyl-accepting chemotaxis protein